MNSHDDLTGKADMDDGNVQEIMTRFRAGLARMADDPAEAARIRGLADKADFGLLSEMRESRLGEGTRRVREAMTAADQAADLVLEALGRNESGEAGADAQSGQGEAGSLAARRAELALGVAELEARHVHREAELEAELTRAIAALDAPRADLEAARIRHQAELAAQRVELEAQRERAELHKPDRRRPGLWGWMHGAVAAPVLILVLMMTAGAAIPLYERAPLVSAVFAGAAAFIAFIYGIATLLSALQLIRSGPSERRAGGEAALRLLLGSLGHEEAIERARSEAIVAAVRSAPPGADLAIHVPRGSKGLEGVSITVTPERAQAKLMVQEAPEWD